MSARFVDVDRETPMFLLPDLCDWVPEEDLVHFILEAVQRLPIEDFQVNHRGSGNRQ
ncbi:MAG: IS5/IS1182 family transposase, partial [Verrucomicrobiaceae bacterium]|nr:IS5/IS1182 family transposase [Verrucomicrobiaceae bacterium]